MNKSNEEVRDPTIAEKFTTYRFSDYKVKVIDSCSAWSGHWWRCPSIEGDLRAHVLRSGRRCARPHEAERRPLKEQR